MLLNLTDIFNHFHGIQIEISYFRAMHDNNGSVRFDIKYELQCNLKPKFPKNCPTNVPFYCRWMTSFVEKVGHSYISAFGLFIILHDLLVFQ